MILIVMWYWYDTNSDVILILITDIDKWYANDNDDVILILICRLMIGIDKWYETNTDVILILIIDIDKWYANDNPRSFCFSVTVAVLKFWMEIAENKDGRISFDAAFPGFFCSL